MYLIQLIIALLATCTFAAKPLRKEVCVASCYYGLLKIKYAASTEKAQAACTHPLRVSSTYYCVALHCDEDDLTPGINWWAGSCANSSKVVNQAAYRKQIANATHAYLTSLPTASLKAKQVFNTSVVPSEASWEVVYTTVYTYDYMRYYANSVRFIPYGFWAIVLLVGMGTRLAEVLGKRKNQDEVVSENSNKPKTLFSKIYTGIKTNLLMAPTFSYHYHQSYGWFTIPLRMHTIIISCYIIIHVAVLAVKYPLYDESYYYPNKHTQFLRYFGDRFGALLSNSLPLVFLFGGRGNIFIILTGWGYRTFNIFHRWIGIVILVESILHGAVFSAFYVNDKGWGVYTEKLAHEDILKYGIMMGVALGLTCTLALVLRRFNYEFFKAGHIILSVIILATFYEHVKDQFAGVYKVWIWICIGIWSGDHLLRLLRMLVMNYKMLVGRDTLALASYSDDTGMIRLQVYPSSISSHQTPGVHYYLYLPTWRVWENHPFSLAGRSVNQSSSPESPTTTINTENGKSVEESVAQAVSELLPEVNKPYLTFLIRPHNGMTRRLRDSLRSSGQRRLRILLEGPYGSAANLNRFNSVIFIAGGSGITALLPYIRMLFEDETNAANVPNVQLIWAVRSLGFARDVFANDLQHTHSSVIAQTKLSEEVYITSAAAEAPKSDGEKTSSSATSEIFKYEKPDIDKLLGNFINKAEGRVAVFVCGPPKMADDTRQMVRKYAEQYNGGGIDLFDEIYKW